MRTLVTVWKKELKKLIFTEEVIRQLESVSEVDWVSEGTPYRVDQFEQDIHRYDACLTSWGSPKLTVEVLAQAKQLSFVGHAAGTLTPYVDPAIFQTPIKVVNANTALAKSTAELAVTLMMSGSWEISNYRDRLKNGLWGDSGSGNTVMGLSGQTVGIIGLGEISREVIRILHAFNTRVLLYSPYCSVEEAQALGVSLCSLEDVLRNSRIVSLHDTLTTSTRGIIGKEQLKLLADGALLINTARGPLIDETALLEQLTSGRISAALDVYHSEPVQADYTLLKLPNVLCLPHIGAFSGYWKSQLAAMVVEDLVRFASGQPCLREVNEERFLRMTAQ